MTDERMQAIKAEIEWRMSQATKILEGGENYDGADGARYVRKLCGMANELIAEINNLKAGGAS